jgi:S-DNA-T family DNA segregation ATPase FtsK/SpoIIIE
MIGIAAAGLSAHAGQIYGHGWIGIALPLFLLLAGMPLAFLATGLRLRLLLRAGANIPAALWWVGKKVRVPRLRKIHVERGEPYDDDMVEFDAADEDDDSGDGYHLDLRPEPLAATKLAERREGRVKREEARRAPVNTKRSKQPALNLASGDYQLPALGLLAEPAPIADNHGLADDAREENARMLEAVLVDFGVKGRITAVRPGPVVTLYEFEPAAGVKSSRVISLADDVARSPPAITRRPARPCLWRWARPSAASR